VQDESQQKPICSYPYGATSLPSDILPPQSIQARWKEGLTVKVLLVDDYEPFRRFASGALKLRPGYQIVGEASDGPEAVRRAEELRPDLILLDIGLPWLNGIAAAQEIRKLVPEAKIIFVSQESDPDIIQESLASGGCAYVLKARAAKELLPAIDAVLAAQR
jgi:DNA-binding NarL/FixJ family response regulator